MENGEEIDAIKVRTGLFALITARLEDAHEIAVKGQSSKTNIQEVTTYVADVQSILDEVRIHLDACQLID